MRTRNPSQSPTATTPHGRKKSCAVLLRECSVNVLFLDITQCAGSYIHRTFTEYAAGTLNIRTLRGHKETFTEHMSVTGDHYSRFPPTFSPPANKDHTGRVPL